MGIFIFIDLKKKGSSFDMYVWMCVWLSAIISRLVESILMRLSEENLGEDLVF